MSSSRPQSATRTGNASMYNAPELFPLDPLADAADLLPGSLDDGSVVRALVTEVIKHCSKSRDQIADEMTVLVGEKITIRMLNSYTSNAAEFHRWPAQYTRAFCHVTGDSRLIRCIAERAGFHLISRAERKLMELGRQVLIQERASAAINRLRNELAEAAL